MNYNPQKERELRDRLVLPAGEYDFEITAAKETVSQKGNDMLALELQIFCPDGSHRNVRDWLVPGSDLGDLKLNRFAHATGLQEAYFNGGLSDTLCVGAVGKCKLTIQDDPQYGSQNRIKDYIPLKAAEETEVELRPEPQGVPAAQTKAAMAAANDEDVPF